MQGIRNIPHLIDFSSLSANRLPSTSPEQQASTRDLEDDEITIESLITLESLVWNDDDQPPTPLADDKKASSPSSSLRQRYRLKVRNILTSSTSPDPVPSFQPQSSSSSSATPTVAPLTSRKKIDIPWWVQKLYELGVDTADISYREYCVSTSNPEWTGEPTLLCCILSVATPIVLTVVGRPSSSRHYTRNTALGLLEQEIHRQLPDVVFQCTSPIGEVEKTADAVERQKRLLQFDVKWSIFFQPLPSWACAPFHSKSPWYLYELVLRTDSGALLAEDRMHLDPSVVTRIGILFPSDIEPPPLYGVDGIAPVIQAKFGVKPRHGCNDEFVTVELRNRSVIDPRAVLTDGTVMVERVELLKQFNRILMDWKTYGQKNSTRDLLIVRNALGQHAGAGRKYLFAPLCRCQKSDNMNTTTVLPLSVDWKLVEEELEGKMRPFLVPSRLGEIRASAVAMTCILLGIAVIAPFFTQMVTRPHLRCLLEPSEILAAGFLCSAALLAGFFSVVPPLKYMSWESLQNRFLCQRKLSYVLAEYRPTVMTSNSAMPVKNLATETVERHQRKYRLNLRNTSFANYFLKKYGLELRYPREILLEAFPVEKHTSHDSLKAIQPKQESCAYLVPELVSIFPMPRDFLYAFGLADAFMPELERAISVSRYASTILELPPDSASASSIKQVTSASKGRPHKDTAVKESAIMHKTLPPPDHHHHLEVNTPPPPCAKIRPSRVAPPMNETSAPIKDALEPTVIV